MIVGTGSGEWADDERVNPQTASDVGGAGVVPQEERGTGYQIEHLERIGPPSH